MSTLIAKLLCAVECVLRFLAWVQRNPRRQPMTLNVKWLPIAALSAFFAPAAIAADLGGNCCADLEERVAELEATTARKGNRKVSVQVSGQVNRTIMYYNDGTQSNAYFGLDNTNSSTRFGISGNAKVSSDVMAGFNLLIDVGGNGRSISANQGSPDGGSADHSLRLRDANVWLESARLGRLTMGRLTTSGPTGTIDLGGVGVVATAGEGCIGTGLAFRDSTGALIPPATIGLVSGSCSRPTIRAEAVKYSSPTFAGFTFNASVGETVKVEAGSKGGLATGADIRYVNEFGGLRLAASVGIERIDNVGSGIQNSWGAALSLLHVSTGLFMQGEYMNSTNNVTGLISAVLLDGDGKAKADRWHLQGGVRRNWFGIGDTSLYGEYGQHNGFGGANSDKLKYNTLAGTFPDKMSIVGFGVVQNVDSAAMELYLGYRRYNLTVDLDGAPSFKPIDVIAAGARIKF
jgi:predicted porin